MGRSLRSLSEGLGLGRKGTDRDTSIGMRRKDFTQPAMRQFLSYCLNDARLCAGVLAALAPLAPPEALDMIDMSVRMYTRPSLELDGTALRGIRDGLRARQDSDRDRLRSLFDFPDRDSFLAALRSTGRFARMLETLGVKVPMKRSPARREALAAAVSERNDLMARVKAGDFDPADMPRLEKALKIIEDGDLIPALAKQDPAFRALMDGPDEDVALLCRMRADNNGSLELTRAETFLAIAERGGTLPIPLMPWGAQTGRYTGSLGSGEASDKVNLQNLPKRGGDPALRRAIRAPEGMVIVACDSAQIEARCGAFVAGQENLLSVFRSGGDPYADMAGALEGVPAERITAGVRAGEKRCVDMRTVGKVTVLSSQYGIGPALLADHLTRAGVSLGPDKEAHDEATRRVHRIYNTRYSEIAAYRTECDRAIAWLAEAGEGETAPMRPFLTLEKAGDGTGIVRLPTGFPLVYPRIRRGGAWRVPNRSSYSYDQWDAGRWNVKGIYGGLLFNNIVQALAFNILWLQGVAVHGSWRVVSNVHDSWIVLCRKDEAEACMEDVREHMRAVPWDWADGLPLDAEAKCSDTYDIA
jgi:DNA polymerase